MSPNCSGWSSPCKKALAGRNSHRGTRLKHVQLREGRIVRGPQEVAQLRVDDLRLGLSTDSAVQVRKLSAHAQPQVRTRGRPETTAKPILRRLPTRGSSATDRRFASRQRRRRPVRRARARRIDPRAQRSTPRAASSPPPSGTDPRTGPVVWRPGVREVPKPLRDGPLLDTSVPGCLAPSSAVDSTAATLHTRIPPCRSRACAVEKDHARDVRGDHVSESSEADGHLSPERANRRRIGRRHRSVGSERDTDH